MIIDLKLGELTHSDVGQMNLCCNYAKRNWMMSDESPPVGIILCADRGHEMAQYAFDGLPNQLMAAKYKSVLPKPALLQARIQKARQALESRLGVYQDRQSDKKSATQSIALRQRKSP